MSIIIRLICLLSLSAFCSAHQTKQHCPGVTPVPLPKPFVGRWYVHASTSCADQSSSRNRLGLFNNRVARCEVIDFYSNGRNYDAGVATHFIDSVYNANTQTFDTTVFDYYTLNSSYSQSSLGVYVAESRNYYEDKPMHGSSSDSSSSSDEEKKRLKQSGKYKFFFACLADTEEYKIFHVCTKFNRLSSNKPVVWILSRSAVLSSEYITSVRSCLTNNRFDFYDSLTFVDHSTCSYYKAQNKYGVYSFNG